jgi:hypothetical protein
MPFVVIVERATAAVEPVGPFEHMEDAQHWSDNMPKPAGVDIIPHIRRVAELVDPKDFKP